MEIVKKITEKTAVSISLVISLIGGIAWLTNLHADTSRNTEQIGRIEEKLDSIEQIKLDVAIIKTELQLIRKQRTLSEGD
jgi:hypothetical protein